MVPLFHVSIRSLWGRPAGHLGWPVSPHPRPAPWVSPRWSKKGGALCAPPWPLRGHAGGGAGLGTFRGCSCEFGCGSGHKPGLVGTAAPPPLTATLRAAGGPSGGAAPRAGEIDGIPGVPPLPAPCCVPAERGPGPQTRPLGQRPLCHRLPGDELPPQGDKTPTQTGTQRRPSHRGRCVPGPCQALYGRTAGPGGSFAPINR